jgi:uncharacterized protein (DUF2235 family)
MALYAFDGTWNLDKPGTEHDTNVTWFHGAYTGAKHYYEGIGTRFGEFGKIVGGITGAGGRDRVRDAMGNFRTNLANGDRTVDIVGFSRGAALALEFANKVCDQQCPVRFLGLWDTVPSFGVAAIPINIGWDLDLPSGVEKCFHAMALDERRIDFKLHRPDARVDDANQPGRLFEVWFRGVHSDVGGGNDCPGLSSIALNWMFAHAVALGLPIDRATIALNGGRMSPNTNISVHGLAVEGRDRTVRWNDVAHQSVSFRSASDMHYNNPPDNVELVDDSGNDAGRFRRA